MRILIENIILNEILNTNSVKSTIECYDDLKTSSEFGNYFQCDFTTINNNKYSVYLFQYIENPNNIKLDNNVILSKILNISNKVNIIEPSFSIFRENNDNLNSDIISDNDFNIDTNNNEVFNVLTTVTKIIEDFINNHNNNYIYFLGDYTDNKRLKIYLKIFNSKYSNIFNKYHGILPELDSSGIFLINKNIIK